GLRLGARGLRSCEADHRPDAFARALDRVADGGGLSVQLRRQRELAQVRLDQLAELIRTAHRSPPPALRAPTRPRPPWRDRAARSAPRAPCRRRFGRRGAPARSASPPAAPAAPRRAPAHRLPL